MLGHSALFCAMAGVDFAIVAASAAIAAEQSRSRFVSIGTCPSGSRLPVEQERAKATLGRDDGTSTGLTLARKGSARL